MDTAGAATDLFGFRRLWPRCISSRKSRDIPTRSKEKSRKEGFLPRQAETILGGAARLSDIDIAASTAPAFGMNVDKDKIVVAALDLLNEAGLAGLSTRALAARLGISGPSLYWHFKNKQELIDHMAQVMLSKALPGPNLNSPTFEWRSWLLKGARGMRLAALSRRDGPQLLMLSQPSGAPYEQGFALMVRTLQRTGLPAGEANATLMCLGRFAIAWAAQESRAGSRQDADFEFGIRMFMQGIEQRISRVSTKITPTVAAAAGTPTRKRR